MVKTAGLLVARRRRALGPLQARPRHRPHPRRRGAGYQPAPVAGDQRRWPRSSSPARARASTVAHALRRRRREAVDLLLPGRRAGLVHRACSASSANARATPATPGPISSCICRSARRRWSSPPSTRSSSADGRPIAASPREPRPPMHTAPRRNEPGRVVVWPRSSSRRSAEPDGLGDAARPSRRREPRGAARRSASPRRSRAGSTAARRSTRDRRPPIRAGGILDPDAHARRADRRHQPRAEDSGSADRRRRPADADRAHRRHGPDGARPRRAAARRRPVAGGGAEEPADRPRRGRALRSRPRPARLAAGTRSPRKRRRPRRLRRGQGALDGWRAAPTTATRTPSSPASSGRDGGRKAFLRRLGAEAEDVLDEFLAQALAYEQSNTPSLEGFLAWLDAGETEIKRDTEHAARRGARDDRPRRQGPGGRRRLPGRQRHAADSSAATIPRVLPLDRRARPGDAGGRSSGCAASRRCRSASAARRRHARERAEEEYRRLLYVGMTRARDRLYVCGITQADQRRRPRLARAGHRGARAGMPTPIDRPTASSMRSNGARPPAARRRPQPAAPRRQQPAPAAARLDAAPAPPAPAAVRAADAVRRRSTRRRSPESPPSPFVAARSMPARRRALERGRLIHRLLQSLPDIAPAIARRVGARYLAASPATERDERIEQRCSPRCIAVLDRSRLSRRSSRRAAAPRSRSPAASRAGGEATSPAASTAWRSRPTAC